MSMPKNKSTRSHQRCHESFSWGSVSVVGTSPTASYFGRAIGFASQSEYCCLGGIIHRLHRLHRLGSTHISVEPLNLFGQFNLCNLCNLWMICDNDFAMPYQ